MLFHFASFATFAFNRDVLQVNNWL